MTDTRCVTGQSQGESLVQLLNQRVDTRNRQLTLLQQELRVLFSGISQLIDKFRATDWHAAFPPDVNNLIDELNGFLKTCEEYPQVLPARPRGQPPFFQLAYSPRKKAPIRRQAIADVCALARYDLLDRVRQCQRTADKEGSVCGRWFFAKKSDSIYCSRDCQTRPTEGRKLRKREYAKRSYWAQKERDQRKRSS